MVKLVEKIKNFFCGITVCKVKNKEESKPQQEKPKVEKQTEEQKQ